MYIEGDVLKPEIYNAAGSLTDDIWTNITVPPAWSGPTHVMLTISATEMNVYINGALRRNKTRNNSDTLDFTDLFLFRHPELGLLNLSRWAGSEIGQIVIADSVIPVSALYDGGVKAIPNGTYPIQLGGDMTLADWRAGQNRGTAGNLLIGNSTNIVASATGDLPLV